MSRAPASRLRRRLAAARRADGERGMVMVITAIFLGFGIAVSFLIPSVGPVTAGAHTEEIDAAAAEIEAIQPLAPDATSMADDTSG